MAKELNEDTTLKLSLKTLAGISVLIFTLVGMWFTLQADIAEAKARDALLEAGFSTVDYACVRDAETLAPPDKRTARRRALIAARLGDIRLIDNMEVR